MKRHKAEIEAIIANPTPPTFANTVEALDHSGELLSEVASVFFAQSGANTNPVIQKVQAEVAPRLAAHQDEISMDPRLFARVKAVYDQRETLSVTAAQRYYLENTLPRVHPQRCEPRPRRPNPAQGHQPAAFPPWGEVQPKPAGRVQRLPAGGGAKGGSCRTAGVLHRRRRRRSQVRRPRGKVGLHRAEALHAALPSVRPEPRPPGPALRRLHPTWRPGQRVQQHQGAGRHRPVACRAGPASWLPDVRPLRAGKPHGPHPRSSHGPSEPLVGCGAPRGQARP